MPKPTPTSQRYALTLDSGREFIIYAVDTVAAIRRFADVADGGLLVYENAAKPVTLKSLGFVKNVAKCPVVRLPPAQEGLR